ncbi:unnamed protein product [Malus baccata var. baccata]
MEDPNKHLKEFEVVCSSMKPINVDGNILKMKAFPFSLMDKAKDWLYELALGAVTSWESMKRAFSEKFFPTSRVILLRKKISGIQQSQVASCPQHQMKEELLLQYFYEGLLPIERQMLDASTERALVDKTPLAAKILIAKRALNAQQYEGVGQRDIPWKQVHEVIKAKINKGMIDTQIHTTQDGEITQTSSGGSLNNLNKKGDFNSPPLGYIKGQSHNLNLNHKQLNQTQKKNKKHKPQQGKTNLCRSPLRHLNRPNLSRFKQSKKEENEKDILETFRKVQVNIPLLDTIKPVPKYAKFLKELCKTRKRISNKEVVQVNNLIFLADFYVLDMEESAHSTPVSILLGRPFMKIARTKIDVFKGTLTMEFDGEIIDFNISEAIKFPKDDHSCFSIDALDSLAEDYLDSLDKDPLETIIVEGLGLEANLAVPSDEVGEMVAALGALP